MYLPWPGRALGEGNGNPPQDSCQENPMDRGAWWATVHGVTESDMTEHTHIRKAFSIIPGNKLQATIVHGVVKSQTQPGH